MPGFHGYQHEMIDFALSNLLIDGNGAGLLADPGLGKTLTTLEVFRRLRELGAARRALIVAPPLVCTDVWPKEIRKWGYDFSTSYVQGTPKQRLKALDFNADIHLIDQHNVKWLSTLDLPEDQWQLLVVDESTLFKNWMAKRTQAVRRKLLGQFPYRLILTGTPAPNGLQDLFPQVYLLDRGAALGKTLGGFRSAWMKQGGFQGRGWVFREELRKALYERIGHLVLRMDAGDHLDLPALVTNRITISLPDRLQRQYDRMEKLLWAELDNGGTLVANSAGAKYALLRQMANGSAYAPQDDGSKDVVVVHDLKAQAVANLLSELQGKPLLLFFQFRHDMDALRRRIPNVPAIAGGTPKDFRSELMDRWNARELPILAIQPAALSHGANLQAGGNDVAWYGTTNQLELFQQCNARVWRQGVTGQVRLHLIIAEKTIDEAMILALDAKATTQSDFMHYLKAYRNAKLQGSC